MKQFRYKAKKGPGEIVEGLISAETPDEAVEKINDMGLLAVDLGEAAGAGQAPAHANHPEAFSKKKPPVSFKAGKISRAAAAHFFNHLARFLKSGVPILPALAITAEQTDSVALSAVLESVKDQVREGAALSRALAAHAPCFSPFDIAMIQAGESTGRLEETLERVSQTRRAAERLRGKIRSALAYPIFLLAAGIAAVLFMLGFVIPKFTVFFDDLGRELPLPTRALIAISGWLAQNGIWLLAGGVLTFVIFSRAYATQAGRREWDRFFLGLPKLGGLAAKAEIGRFARTLEMLLRSGIPLLKSVKIALPVLANEEMKRELGLCADTIEEGGTLSQGLRRSRQVPPFVIHLVRIGEEAGRLEDSARDIADWYEQEIDEALGVMTQLLEPAVILIVGAFLGLMIIAVLLPVFEMSAVIP